VTKRKATSKTKAKKKTRKTRKKAKGGLAQKFLVALSGVVLILCASSITYGFFVRLDNGEQRQFRIEVLNGTGQAGLAHEAKRELLRRGIDVIETGNADNFEYTESVLIARKANAEVRELGRILGCKQIIEQIREGTLEDASLILGADYRDLELDWASE
jgi:hypothetical protein